METPQSNFKPFLLKNYVYVFYFLSFAIPFTVFLKTMNPSSFGWDTTWFHIQIPILAVGQTTGFPIAFLTGKLFSFLPVGTMAYRLNMYSVFWGAATIFVLFVFIKNLLKKNQYWIALVSAVFFGFFKVFWFQTSRFEVYTLTTFFTVIILLMGHYWTETKSNRFLYLYYFLIGISFTNHPISLFLAPAFILYPVYTDWRQVFKIKKFFIILALIIFPNLLYLYIPIRSYQGYGNIKTLSQFIDYISGSKWKGHFGFKGWELTRSMFSGYLDFLKGDFTIVVLVIFILGLVFIAVKKRGYFALILSLIVLNFIPIVFYEQQATDFYFTTMAVFLCVPFACGLYAIKEAIAYLFHRYLRKRLSRSILFLKDGGDDPSQNRKLVLVRSVFLLIFFLAIAVFPVNLFAANYREMDKSRDTYVYDYWKGMLENMAPGSLIITNSATSHVITYLNQFEVKKDIDTTKIDKPDAIKQIINENIEKKQIYYVDAYLPDISNYYDMEQFGDRFYQEGFVESFLVYMVKDIKVDVEILADADELDLEFGRKADIVFYIKNNSSYRLDINSIELNLPKILKFIEMKPDSDMKTPPGTAQGLYMWTAGPYSIEPGAQFVLSFIIQANAKARGEIELKITTGNMYVDGPKIKVSIK